MKNEVLIIPDVHGLNFWEEPCKEWDGIIIFLGDYVDPYPPVSKEEALVNLKKIVEFSKNTKCTCKFLLGNHDWSYFSNYGKCRYDYANSEMIKELLDSLNLTLCTTIKSQNKEYLFSHAGITPGWLGNRDYLDSEFIIPNEFINISEMLNQVPIIRGGDAEYGSCIWNDIYNFVTEYDKSKIKAYQIFGHSWEGRTNPIIEKDFAMLDCHKAFILNINTGEIKEYA